MQVGKEVSFVDRNGVRFTAIITDISGVGPSNYKALNLRYTCDGNVATVENVPHEGDANPGSGFWLFKGQTQQVQQTKKRKRRS